MGCKLWCFRQTSIGTGNRVGHLRRPVWPELLRRMVDRSSNSAKHNSLGQRLQTLPLKFQALLLVGMILVMAIIAIVSGGRRWAALRPSFKSRTLEIARRLKPIEEEVKRRDEVVQELTGTDKK
jgi:hypothetical protein